MTIIVIRTIILYILIVFSLRIMGKRQLGELQPSELVVTLLVSNVATLSIEDTNVPLLGSILPIMILVCCQVFVSLIIMKNSRIRKFISGNPCIIIRDGAIDQKELKSLRWSLEDLTEQLRVNGIFDIEEVDYAIVETSGSLSAYQKYSARPLCAKSIANNKDKPIDSPPITIISNGELVKDALNYLNKTTGWLDNILLPQKLEIKDIFLMTCDKADKYYIVKKQL